MPDSRENQNIEQEVKDLRLKRGVIKANITRCRTYLNKLDLENINKKCFLELQRRLSNLNPIIHEFNSVQEKIELLTNNCETEQIERDNFESDYYDICSYIEEILEKSKSKSQEPSADNGNSNQLAQIVQAVQTPISNVQIFTGDYNKWVQFRDCFQAVVGRNATLSGVQKLFQLRKALSPEVLKNIESLALTDANYEVAWNVLVKRYEKSKRIVETHIREILDFPCLTKESAADLRNLYNTINNNLLALRNLDKPVDQWDDILVPIIVDKLDSKTKREYESRHIEDIEKNPSDTSSPTIKSVLSKIEHKCELLENLEKRKHEMSKLTIKNTRSENKYSFSSSHLNTKASTISCYFCKREHTIYKCPDFIKLSVPNRIQEIKKLKYCLNCLRPHDAPQEQCASSKCKKCKKLHNTLLHIDKNNFGNTAIREVNDEAQKTDTSSVRQEESLAKRTETAGEGRSLALATATPTGASSENKNVCLFSSSQVLLNTAIIFVRDAEGHLHEARVLLDSGSMSNFISEKFFDKLNVEKIPINHSISGVGQVSSTIRFKSNITISSTDKAFNEKVSCLILSQITSNIPLVSFSINNLEIPKDIQLADPDFNISRPIDMLLGAGIFWKLLKTKKVLLKRSNLSLQQSELGWLVSGEITNKIHNNSVTCLNTTNLESQITKFWETEEVFTKPALSESELFCEKHFLENYSRDKDGHVVVKIPFKENYIKLGDSRKMALDRFLKLEKRFANNTPLYNEYVRFMNEYETMKHMRVLSIPTEREELNYYIPHHPVIRESSCTTRLRVVYDASMKSTSGLSLNDVQHVGPTIQNELFIIILQFRLFKFVVSADISKMYRMVRIHDDDKRFQRIFWRRNPSEEIKCYELATVTYGTASAPYLAIRSLQQVAKENENKFPAASKAILNNFYVDDFLYGSDSISEILQIQADVTAILKGAGMHLRKWLCNERQLINKFALNSELEASVMNLGENENCKTLGISWNSTNDTILYESSLTDFNKNTLTKRVILSQISQIFDPLGLLGPIIIVGKILMQKLWQSNTNWDEIIPDRLKAEWLRFYKELNYLKDINIPRQVTSSERTLVELHGFGDASERAYGACIYVRTRLKDGKFISRLLCAKSRVAPLKKLSLPRLELSSALLLARLIDKVKNGININIDKIFLWSDSTIAISWIRGSPSRWKTFVANRVSEIQRLTKIENWNHVISSENPADLISRGTTILELKNKDFWWTGPTWLIQENLPIFKLQSISDDIPEQRSVTNTAIQNDFELFSRFSSLTTLQRVTTYCLRFIANSKNKVPEQRFTGILSVQELQNALYTLIRLAQKGSFPKEYSSLSQKKPVPSKSKILSLSPFLDNENILRVGGRLKNSEYAFDKKFPIILPSDHKLTKLILKHEHNRLLHCGYSTLLASIRERFWPIRGRYLTKGIIRSCVTCFKSRPKTPAYLMGELPKIRITPSFPFCNVGVDYAGPFLLKDRVTRNAKLVKSYICLFVCLATKAIHLELVANLTTECFLAAFRRFIGRRGKPSNIYSDNAKNFVGASRELKEFYDMVNANNDLIQTELSKEMITWHFIPAKTPSFGGLWEAGIKNVKSHLKRIVGNANLSYEDFLTVLIQIEAVVNSRPLCPLSTDPDVIPLTPGHFLIGRNLTSLPEVNYTEIPENRLKRYQRLQQLVQQFWARWHKEYLSELQVRTKWKRSDTDNNIAVGKVVLVKEENVPPMQWPLGIIVNLHPGKDNIVRVVSVKVRGQTLKRGLEKICVLPEEF